jgi:hypothetical protein
MSAKCRRLEKGRNGKMCGLVVLVGVVVGLILIGRDSHGAGADEPWRRKMEETKRRLGRK